jgi:hypothetical protein
MNISGTPSRIRAEFYHRSIAELLLAHASLY